MYGIIYIITNIINGKVYVGQTTQTLIHRKKDHRFRFVHKTYKNSIVYLAFEKYGWDNFVWAVVHKCYSKEELDEMESFYIDEFNSKPPNGYNLTDGGDGGTLGYKHTKEDKIKMSKLKDGMYLGENNPFYGKHHTKEAKQAMSVAKAGTYKITFPDGTVKIIQNLTKFCDKYELDRSSMCKVMCGKYKQHKGFKCEKK